MKSGKDTPAMRWESMLETKREFISGQGRGIHLKAMKPFYDFVFKHLVDRAELHNGEALLPQNGRPVVIITAHGPGLAWVPILALTGKYLVENGCGDTVGGMYPHKAVFWIPGLKAYYKKHLGTPTEVNSVEDLVQQLKNREITITGTAPEGANNFLSFGEYVGPFRSVGMIAAAIKAGADLVLLAHQGAEPWNVRINLPFGWEVPNAYGLRGFYLTLPPYKKLDYYIAMAKRYKPSMTARDFEKRSKREARLMLGVEVEKIRAQMNLMTDEVKNIMAGKRIMQLIRRGY